MRTEVFITLAGIFGAAVVALLCDLLRVRHIRLKEAKVEQRVRKIETALRNQRLAAAQRVAREAQTQRPPAAFAAPEPVLALPEAPPRMIAPPAAPEPERPAARRETPLVREQPKPAQAANGNGQVVSEWLVQRAMRRAAGKAEPAEAPPPRPAPKAFAPVVIDEGMWKSLFGASDPAPETAPGLQPREVLASALEKPEPFRGVVCAVGVTAPEGEPAPRADMAREFVGSLLEAGETSAEWSPGVFLIVAPGLQDSEARRRLARLSERLWNQQLRAFQENPLLFSMGATDVEGDTLSEAVGTAIQRMEQTRRTRTALLAGVRQPVASV